MDKLKAHDEFARQHSENPEERLAEIKEKVRGIIEKKKKTQADMTTAHDQCDELDQRLAGFEAEIKRLQREGNKKEQALQRDSRFQEQFETYKYIRDNAARFNAKVYGPIMMELEVDRGHRAIVERALGRDMLTTFVVQNKEDMATLSDFIRQRRLRVNVKAISDGRANFNSPVDLSSRSRDADNLKRLGLECWLDDLIECPDPVRDVIQNWGNSHKQAIVSTSADTDGVFATLERLGQQSGQLLSTTNLFRMVKSRYGNKDSSTNSTAIGQPKGFLVDGNAGNEGKIQSLKQQFDKTNDAREEHYEKYTKSQLATTKLSKEQNDLTQEAKALRDLPTTRRKIEKRISQLDEELDTLKGQQDMSEALRRIDAKIAKAERKKLKPLLAMPALMIEMQRYTVERIQADFEMNALRDEIRELETEQRRKVEEVDDLAREKERRKQKMKEAETRVKDALRMAKEMGNLTEELKGKIEEAMVRPQPPSWMCRCALTCSVPRRGMCRDQRTCRCLKPWTSM